MHQPEKTTTANSPQSQSQRSQNQNPTKKNILVFIPIGLPAMGKTSYIKHFSEIIKEKGFGFHVLCSDEIRKKIMDALRAKHPSICHQEAYDTTGQEAEAKFFESLEDSIVNGSRQNREIEVIFMDKNHPPEEIKRLINFLREDRFKQDYNIKIVIIRPSCVKNYLIESNAFPFSLSLLMKCLRRAIDRKNHETLVGEKEKMVRVLLFFFKSYTNFGTESSHFESIGADLVVKLPFTDEDEETEKKLHDQIAAKLNEALEYVEGFTGDPIRNQEFLDAFEKIEEQVRDPDDEVMMKASKKNVEKSLQLFKDTPLMKDNSEM